MRVLALGLIATAWLSVSQPASSLTASRLFENPRLGYTLRIPRAWQASVRPADNAAVITSLPVRNRHDNPERIRLPRGGVYMWIFDYGIVPDDGFPGRPIRIELGEKRMHPCGFGEGYTVRFTDHGRLLHAFIKLGPFAGKRNALAVLNSLHVTSGLVQDHQR